MKPKPVNWQLIPYSEDDDGLYDQVNDLISKFHDGDDGIVGVGIILMWRHNIKMDQDDYVLLTDITRSPDKMRELHPHDVVIGINKDAWSILEEDHQAVVLDAQLERIAVCRDKDNNPKEDDRSRTIYRLRRPEVVDEATLKRRHGMTMQDAQEFVHDKFCTGDAEEGSYVADQLADNEVGGDDVDTIVHSLNPEEDDSDSLDSLDD